MIRLALFLNRKFCFKKSFFLKNYLNYLLFFVNFKLDRDVTLTLHRALDVIVFSWIVPNALQIWTVKKLTRKALQTWAMICEQCGSYRNKNKTTKVWTFLSRHSFENVYSCMLKFTSLTTWKNTKVSISIHIWIEKEPHSAIFEMSIEC